MTFFATYGFNLKVKSSNVKGFAEDHLKNF